MGGAGRDDGIALGAGADDEALEPAPDSREPAAAWGGGGFAGARDTFSGMARAQPRGGGGGGGMPDIPPVIRGQRGQPLDLL